MAQKRRSAMRLRGRIMLPGRNGARRLLAEARDMAQSVGETTVGTARGIAAGARDAAVGVARGTQEAAGRVAGRVRENPWPALLVGAGATWMIVEAARAERRTRLGGKAVMRRAKRAARRAVRDVSEAARGVQRLARRS